MTAAVLKSFREFVTELRQPAPYFPGVTEFKGALNIGFGSMQLVASQYMKYSSDPRLNGLSKRHTAIGTEAIRIGFRQFVPGFVIGMSLACLVTKIESQ